LPRTQEKKTDFGKRKASFALGDKRISRRKRWWTKGENECGQGGRNVSES